MIKTAPVTQQRAMLLYPLLILQLITSLTEVYTIEYISNFNSTRINPNPQGDPISLPIILQNSQPRLPHSPSEYPTYSSTPQPSPSSMYTLKRYQLKDTKYNPETHSLNQLQKSIIYNMQPPQQIFDVSRSITFEDYQLLEIKNIRIMLINPTDKFKFCVNQIYMDSEAVKRIQHRRLPLCLNPNNKYPFFFNLYISQQKPIIFRTSVYFIISIYDGKELVDEKIWPRQIITKVSQNHLKLLPLQSRYCQSPKNQTPLTIPNPHNFAIKISIQNQMQPQKNIYKQILIPPLKHFKTTIISKQSIISITTKPYEGYGINQSQPRFPKLYIPVYCVKPLEIDFFSIGVLNTQRSVVEILVPVTSSSKEVVQVVGVGVWSDSQTIEIAELPEFQDKIMPGGQHIGVFRLLAHLPKEPCEKTTIDIKITYFLQSSPKQLLQSKRRLSFLQLRNPLSLQGRRFIDVSKPPSPSGSGSGSPTPSSSQSILSNIFPIRNNLNLPLLLVRVIFDQKQFKLTWLKDRREYIYPNQKKDQFSLQYIGSRQLKISPVKNIIMLQFNGNLFIPIEILVYDNTLQCVYANLQQKCQNLNNIDFGYFRNNATKFKQLVIRNWNPGEKEISIRVGDRKDNFLSKFGMNVTLNVFGPYPNYELVTKNSNNTLVFYLKGGHFIIVNFGIIPYKNATSGQIGFQISTVHEKIVKKLKFKVQNGTIALIPQTLRINSIYQKTVEYLNLVSTFSQPYKIRSTFVNNSHISIYFNNHSEIYENQWIGLALVYEPFPNLSHTSSSTPSYVVSQQVGTDRGRDRNVKAVQCCGTQFFINSFLIPHSLDQYRRFTYVSVRVVTTTDLETNSTIIIDNTPPKLIAEDNFTISLINFKKQKSLGTPSSSSASSSSCPASSSCPDPKQFRIRLKNPLKQPLKLKPTLIPRHLYQHPKPYLSTQKQLHQPTQCYFCVNNQIAIKHNFSPQLVKSLFTLQSTPLEVTIQPLQNDQYYIGSSSSSFTRPTISSYYASGSKEITQYMKIAVGNGARICYRMNTSGFVRELVESYVVNQVAENFSSEVFQQFVEKEVETGVGYYLESDEFYQGIFANGGGLQKYCSKTRGQGSGNSKGNRVEFPIFRFCKYVGIVVQPSHQIVLENQTETDIVIRASRDMRDMSQMLYLVILNNVTKGQAHLVTINITQPKLQIIKGSEHPPLTPKHIQKLVKQQQQQSGSPGMLKRLQSQTILLPRLFSTALTQKLSLTLRNPNTLPINITHIGFENTERICQYRNIKIGAEHCGGFLITNTEDKQITFQIGGSGGGDVVRAYFYVGDQYYFRIVFLRDGVFGDDRAGVGVWKILAINGVSFGFMVLVIAKLKKQIDYKQKTRKSHSKSHFLASSSYSKLGIRSQRKARKLQQIPEQLIVSLKQMQQKRIKQFFNSSDESEIAKRQHTEQQQPSIQILNVLKNDKNNISVSEESSLDFIDLQALNKSTQGEGDEENGEPEPEPEGSQGKRDDEQVSNEEYVQDQDNSQGSLSDADSNFTEGDVGDVDYPANRQEKKQNYGWGDPTQQRKKQEDSNSYYNVFFSQNPLKKKQSSGLFPWMIEHQRTHHHR